jgi:hypothetical protein
MLKRISFIFFLLLSSSCFDQNDCLITSTNLVQISLNTVTGIPMLVTFLRVLKGDSTGHFPLYEKYPLDFLALPLNPDSTQTTFRFMTSDTVYYRLTLGYSTYSRVIATDCGAFLYYDNLTVLKTNFDSTLVISPQLLTSVTSNLKIFF